MRVLNIAIYVSSYYYICASYCQTCRHATVCVLRCSQQARGQGSETEREQLLAEEGRRRAVEMRLEEQRAKEEEARKLEYARQECELQLQVQGIRQSASASRHKAEYVSM